MVTTTPELLTERLRKLGRPRGLLGKEEAKQFGFDLQDDWFLNVDWLEGMEKPYFTFVSPDKWKYKDITYDDTGEVIDYMAYSPEGNPYTKAQLEELSKEEQAPVPGAPEEKIVFPQAPPIPAEMAGSTGRVMGGPEYIPSEYELPTERPSASNEVLAELGLIPGIPSEMAGVTGAIPLEIEVKSYVKKIFPQENEDEVLDQAISDYDTFIQKVSQTGRTAETEGLLRVLGFSGEEIDQIVPLDFQKIIKGESEVPTTPEIEAQKSWWKTFYLSLRSLSSPDQLFKKIFSIMPSPPRTGWESAFKPPLPPEAEAAYQQVKLQFAQNYTKGRLEFDDWVKKHPEYQLPQDITEFIEQVRPLPLGEQVGEYLKNKRALGYVIAKGAPPTLAALAAYAGVTALTGSHTLGAMASYVTLAPMQMEDVAQDLISAGVPENKAYELAIPVGALIAGLDVTGNIPFMKAIAPALAPFKKGLQKELVNRTVVRMLKKGLTTFAAQEFTETLTEVAQQIIQDYTVSFFDKTRNPFENVNQTVVQTLIQVSPFALFGGAVSVSTARGGQPVKLAELYQEKIDEYRNAGLDMTEAHVQALNDIANLPEGEAAIKAAHDEIAGLLPDFTQSRTAETVAGIQAGKFEPTPSLRAIQEARAELKPMGGKEPWQMIRQEFIDTAKAKLTHKPTEQFEATATVSHKRQISRALSEGKPVPNSVLADYPDLQAEAPITPGVTKLTSEELAKVPTLAELRKTGGFIDSETDLSALIQKNGDFAVGIKDVNGARAIINASDLQTLTDNKVFTDRIREVYVAIDPTPIMTPRIREGFMSGLDVGKMVKESSGIKPPLIGELADIGNIKLTNASTVTSAQRQKFVEMITDSNIRTQLKDLGIKEVRIEAPYKFSLSEQANVSLSEGVIRINADAANPSQSVLHELGHKRFSLSTKAEQNKLIVLAKQATDPTVQGYLKNEKYEEAIAELFANEKLAIPKAEPGMPEAGYQPTMIEGVTGKEVRPAGMELKQEIARTQAEVAAMPPRPTPEVVAPVPSAEIPEAPPAVPPAPPSQSVTLSPTPPAPKRLDRIISMATKQAEFDRPGVLARILHSIPGLRQAFEYIRPGLKMTGESEKLLIAMNAEQMAKSDFTTTSLPTYVETMKLLKGAFGIDALKGEKLSVKLDNEGNYILSPNQMAALDLLKNRNDMLLEDVVQNYGAEIGLFTPQAKGAVDTTSSIAFTLLDVAQRSGVYLPNVDISEDVVEYLGSETRAVASGRAKTRIWQTASERMAHDKTFKPELDVTKLIQGMDNFKSNAAGGRAFRAAIGGFTRLEAMEKTHPKLYDRMISLKKGLQSLKGSAGRLNVKLANAIDTFLDSSIEGTDLSKLRESLDVKLERGPRAGMDIEAIQSEIDSIKAEISELRPMWEVANLKPYVLVQEGIFRYFPSDLASLIKESRKVGNSWLVNLLFKWRGGAFSGDLSPFSQQGHIALLASPFHTLRSMTGAARTAFQKHQWNRSFTIDALAEDVSADIVDWGEFAALRGIKLSATPEEFVAGFLSYIPGVSKATRASYIPLTRNAFYTWKRLYQNMVKHGIPELDAKIIANQQIGATHLIAMPARMGQSQSRATFLRSLPTSYSFIAEPVSVIAQATTGFAKLLTFQKLTARESVAVKTTTTLASSVMAISVTSAVLSAMAKGGDGDDIRKAAWDAINPHPLNGRFANIIIGDVRIPIGGPYRAIFRAIYPQQFKDIPFPVPFAGLPNYLYNRVSPALKTQLELFRNKDYYNNQILTGNLPERIIRGALYELEGSLPLTAGEAAEALRRGDEYTEDLKEQVISQFMGVNLFKLGNTYFERETGKLGLVKEDGEGKPNSIEQPDITTTKDLWTAGRRVMAARKRGLGVEEGFNDSELLKAVMDASAIKEQVDLLPNEKLININADPDKGDTFIEYYKQWQDRLKDPEKYDEQYPNNKAYYGNFSQRQFALLNEYWAITDKKKQAEFLKLHESEIGVKPRDEFLRTHPKENAQLAVWGQAKILTKEAYNQFLGLVKALDIPDSALPELTLPPEGSIDNYFKYQDMVSEGKESSWGAKLMLAKDDDLRKFLEREPIDTPIASLELKVKHQDLFELRDSYSDKDSPDYLDDTVKDAEGLTARGRAIRDLKDKNPEWVKDMRRIEAIEHNGADYQEAWVERGEKVDLFGGGSAEARLWLVDHPDAWKWALDEKLLTDDGKGWNVPSLRVTVKWRTQDDWYDEGVKDKHDKITYTTKEARDQAISLERDQFLAGNEQYRKDRRRRDAYELVGPKPTFTKFPSNQVENYVAYNELPEKGKRRDRFLINNPDFAQAMHTIKGMDLPDPTKVPSVRFDELYEKWTPEFDRMAGLGDNKSEFYIEGEKAREAVRKAMRFKPDGMQTDFRKAELERAAYGLLIPDKYIKPYVEYYSIQDIGKPKTIFYRLYPEVSYYGDDWWMMEHLDFYKDVYLGILGRKRWDYEKDREELIEVSEDRRLDFREVPTRAVFAKYQTYVQLPKGKKREDFRWDNPDLEEWLLLTKKVTVPIKEQRRKSYLTPGERVGEDIDEMITRLKLLVR